MADYYSQEKDTSSNETEDSETKPEDSKEETALIPKSLTGDRECKPGEKLTVEVVKVYDSELEIKVIGYNDKKDKKPKPDKEESDMDMEDSMSKLDRMAMMPEEE